MRKIAVFLLISSVFAENNFTLKELQKSDTFKERNSTKEIQFKPTNPEPMTKEKGFFDNIEFKGYLRFRFEKDV